MNTGLKKCLFIMLDIAIAIVCVGAAAFLRFEFNIPPYYYQPLLTFLAIVTSLTFVFSLSLKCYDSVLAYFGFIEVIKQGLVCAFAGSFVLILKMMGVFGFSGSITIIYCGLFFVMSSAIRGVPRVQRWVRAVIAAKYGDSKRVIIIGAGKTGAMIAEQFLTHREEGFYPIGFADNDKSKHGMKVAGVKVFGSVDTVTYYASKLEADEILIVLPSADEGQIAEIYDTVSSANIPIKIFQSAVDVDNFKAGDKKALKEVSIEDLLFREQVEVETSLNESLIKDKVVLVTGGAGSIGSELCRQVLRNKCKKLVIYDINENGLFDINEELKNKYKDRFVNCIGSVRDIARLASIFDTYKPDIVFHAAAHKHVPMMEINPVEAVKNNIFGTTNMLETAIKYGVKRFILISTDKAVNPTNVMGATKRVCELLVKANSSRGMECVAVRFGNVLGSNGSAVPLFKKQIAEGGPVTVTHKDMTRYFMTIKEAVSLVLSAGASAKGSELFVLDMGKPVKIYDLAINLIRLSGLVPFKDIEIEITGLREGEKMFEELKLDSEIVDKTSHKKIFIMRDNGVDTDKLASDVKALESAITKDASDIELKELLLGMLQ